MEFTDPQVPGVFQKMFMEWSISHNSEANINNYFIPILKMKKLMVKDFNFSQWGRT